MFASQLGGSKVPPTGWLMDSNRKLDGAGLMLRTGFVLVVVDLPPTSNPKDE